MDYLKKSRIEEVLIAILGKGTVTSQLISRIEKILDAIRAKDSYDGIVMSEVEEILVCILLGERYEKPTHSRIAAMLKVKANGGEYTEPRKSRVEELIFEWIEGTSKIITYTGTLPATLQTVAGYLAGYKIWGNTGYVGVETENLAPFIDEWRDGYVNARGFIAPADENMKERCSPHIAVEPGATYQLAYQTGSFPESSTSRPWTGVGWYNDDGFIERRAGYDRTTVTLVAPANATYAILSFRSYGENHNVMFIKASTSPASYIPYGYKLPILSNDATTDIYIGDTQLAKDEYVDSAGKIYRWADITGLSEPLCGIGTYADSLDLSTGTLTRRIKKLVFDGTESWTAYKSGANTFFYTSVVSSRRTGPQYIISSHFVGANISTTSTNIGVQILQTQLRIRPENVASTTTSDFKSFFAAQYANGTPVTVWYVLAEPETSTVPVPSGLIGTIEGYLIQDGTPTPESPIYPTANGAKQADGTYTIKNAYITPTDPPVPLPQIPTAEGETTIDYGIAALPHAAGLDGIFEYGNINGLTWKNSVSDENDITFDTAVTDTGAEYVLPAGATGQYTSKSGEYRTAFTWYCVAKCPTTCHSAGQYMISNLGNGIGVEISSGWAAYSSAGGNHLVRGVDNRDYNSQMPVTGYALMAVAGDVNGVASVYVNGVKMTDSWNFSPAPLDRAAAVFLGKRASGQLSGTDIDYKFLAFGTTKQTDAEIIANSQYLMTNYPVGRPEKVELTYKTP